MDGTPLAQPAAAAAPLLNVTAALLYHLRFTMSLT